MPRLSPSEQRLLVIFLTVIGLVAGILLFGMGMKAKENLTQKLRLARTERSASESLLGEETMWKERGRWLDERLPRYASRNAASPRMQEAAKAAAERHGIKVVSQKFITESDLPENPAASVVGFSLDFSGQLPQVVSFLHELQQPGRFIEVRMLNMRPDGDTGNLICTLELLQYFREG
jgi:hypothetical protein